MNIEQANAIPLSEILHKIGAKLIKQKNSDEWYNSPLRQEKTASFHINTRKNVWYDFGAVKGGRPVDLICAYLESHNEDHNVVDALRWLNNMMALPSANFVLKAKDSFEASAASITLQNLYELKNTRLISYLSSRGISLPLGQKYLKEVLVKNTVTKKVFFALGFINEGNGIELRNKIFKGCIAPKSITFIRGTKSPADEVHVFEGFMDFLSAAADQPEHEFDGDVIILNSVACLPQAIPYIKGYTYRKLYSWFDNDDSGLKATKLLKEIIEKEAGFSFRAMNKAYAPHKDVNAWRMHKLKL